MEQTEGVELWNGNFKQSRAKCVNYPECFHISPSSPLLNQHLLLQPLLQPFEHEVQSVSTCSSKCKTVIFCCKQGFKSCITCRIMNPIKILNWSLSSSTFQLSVEWFLCHHFKWNTLFWAKRLKDVLQNKTILLSNLKYEQSEPFSFERNDFSSRLKQSMAPNYKTSQSQTWRLMLMGQKF